jgi:hypothetical protein
MKLRSSGTRSAVAKQAKSKLIQKQTKTTTVGLIRDLYGVNYKTPLK